ncbi:tetratricopeptide repeat protein [Archangium gephyra]|uniref:PKA regulatory subunit-like protein n=1 Tax=Archangium gephyra TaxID=48 RepID=A0AAC8Q4B0_9BACT|nr:cyclic nucleotide-binding domain-containing protein [Archangium gephyra]AKJ00201.1 PKA regulatory subunit-like protein [Archangium gephyra]REG33102.1 tetratricopeptide repeat protein [Archangium gephyra]
MAHPTDEAQQSSRQYKESAAAHILQGKPEEALADYRKAVELNPHDSAARLKVAELLAQLGHQQEAVREFHSLAIRYAAEGNTLHAIAACKLILAIDPQHAETQENLASLIAIRSAEERQSPSEPEPPSTPLFSKLPRDVFLALLELLEMRRVNGGEHIITEGERSHSMFILVQGTVRVVHAPENAPPRTLAELTEGSFFGEMGLMSDAPRTASVIALRDCTLLEVTRDMLARLGARFPTFELVVQQFYKDRLLDNLLESNPVFQPLSEEQKRAIAQRFQTRTVEPGTVLLQQGQRSHALHLLLRGRCSVVHQDPDGGERPYPDMTEGALFGEISLLLDLRITATVRAATSCLLLVLDQETVKERVLTHPEVRRALTHLSRERLDRTAALLAEGAEVRGSFLI